MSIEKITGPIDVIGIEVIKFNNKVETMEEAQSIMDLHTTTKVELVQGEDGTFMVTTMVSDINSVTGVIPEDLEAKDAIPIQVKVAEMLTASGLKSIGINDTNSGVDDGSGVDLSDVIDAGVDAEAASE